jgi:GT2 family glycosyltransferase
MHYPNVSIIFVNYNSKKYAEESINSILKQNYPKSKMQLIVIDNASTDDSVEFLKKRFGNRIELIKSEKNTGFAGGANLGLKYVKGELILFFNIDAVAQKDFLKTIISELLKDENIVTISAFDFVPGTDLSKADASKGYSSNLLGSNTLRDKPDFKTISGSGCVILIRKNKMIPFDEDYFMYFEDTKLTWEFNAMGYDTLLSPKCKVWHYGSATSGKISPLKTYYSERNRTMTLLTCFEFVTLLKLIPLFITDSLFRFFSYITKPKLFIPFLRAQVWVLTHLSFILKKRREFDRIRVLRDKNLLHLFSYKLFPTHRGNGNSMIWRPIDFLTRSYLKIVSIRTYDM